MQSCSKREKSFQEGILVTRKVSAFFNVPRLYLFVLESFQLLVVIFQLLGTLIKKIRQDIGVLIRQPAIEPKPEFERSCVNVKR